MNLLKISPDFLKPRKYNALKNVKFVTNNFDNLFFFQTPSAVNKIKQLLKDKPEHVSKTNQTNIY